MFVKFFLSGLTLLVLLFDLSAKELKVLTIGNSFSQSLGVFLPQLVKSEKQHRLLLTNAYIGGCSLEKHYKHLLKAEKDPAFKPYSGVIFDSQKAKGKPFRSNLPALLQQDQYDVISIQQNSANSWKSNTFEPYASELIKYIRKNQKTAKIVIQQTWAYRIDAPRLKRWKLSQQQMYKKLHSAYRQLAEKYSLPVIPMADAVEIYRQLTPVKYKPTAPGTVFQEPALPSFAGDAVGLSQWRTNRKTEKRYIQHDYSHLNNTGKYLQAVLWYSFLFGEKADSVKFVPPQIPVQDALLVKKCARQALDDYKQVK